MTRLDSKNPPLAAPSPPARRVIFFVNTLKRGGTERNVTALCKHIDKSRYAPEVWLLHAGGQNEEAVRAAGVPIRHLQRGWAYNPFFALSTARKIARSDADIFHVFLPSIMFYVGLSRLVFRARQPIIYSEATSLVSRRFLHHLRAWFIRTQCAGYAANSVVSRAFLVEHGVDEQRIRLIPNGHEIEQFRRPIDRQAIRQALGVASDEKLVLFVGRLIDSKRVCDLVDAARLLRDAGLRLRVVIAGDGPERPALEAQNLRDGGEQSVQFVGMRGDVADLLRSADMFVFPSELEGLSNAVIEAALAGLPIVGCDVGGVRDVVSNGSEAQLVPPRDPAALAAAISRYIEDEGLAERHATAARERAEREYSIDNTLQRLYGLYDQILGNPA